MPDNPEGMAMPDGAGGQEALPNYLRADAPPAGVCSICLRKTWDEAEVGRHCGMPQPDGSRCYGYFYGRVKDGGGSP